LARALSRNKKLVRDLFNFGGGTNPSPTTLRHVSGKNNRRARDKDVAKMVGNQNIHFQPRYWLRSPPVVGGREGPSIAPTDANPT